MKIYINPRVRNTHPTWYRDAVLIFRKEGEIPLSYEVHPDMIEATKDHFIIYEESPRGQCDPMTKGKILFKCNMSIVDYYERKIE